MKFRVELALIIVISILLINPAYAGFQISNQGSNVKYNGAISNGNLQVYVYDSSTGGSLLWDSNSEFNSKITNGTWSVMLGENNSNPLNLQYGALYYMDYSINGTDLNFTNLTGNTIDRLFVCCCSSSNLRIKQRPVLLIDMDSHWLVNWNMEH